MKKLLTSVAMALLLVGCAKEYNDSALQTRVSELERKVTALESSVAALQSAIGEGVFVAKVQEYADPETGKTIGVTVTYTSGDVKYFEISPKNDYTAPVLGVISYGDGQLVWAVDGIAIQVNGNVVPVYQTPAFTIDEDGYLWVSIDGQDPVKLGQVQNEGATLVDGIFTDIKVEADKIVLTLSDNTTVNIPFAEAFKLNIETTEYLYQEPNKPIEIAYTVSAKTENTEVGVAGYNPSDFSVEVAEDKIIVTPLKYNAGAVMMVYADAKIGLTSVVAVTVEHEGVEVVDAPKFADGQQYDYIVRNDGGNMEAHVVANVDFKVTAEDDWIHYVETKGTLHTIVLKIDANPTQEAREGSISLYKNDNPIDIIQVITIWQDKGEGGDQPGGDEPGGETGVADLSQLQSANSYMVLVAGDYKFKAVKGNSTESVGAVASAEILWETENTATAPEQNSIIAKAGVDGDYITFSTPAEMKAGNALIAAKNAAGDILWSWHIWIPASEVAVKDGTALCGAPIMDRNLGALTAMPMSGDPDPLSIGLAYQWGRKDPFPGIVSFSSNTGAAVAGENWTSIGEHITTAYSIAHPTVYAHIPEVDAGVWNVDDPQDLWNDAENKKTIYDPCPPGYRVPLYDSSLPMWSGAFDSNWTIDKDNFRFAYGEISFPVGGYIDCWTPAYEKTGVRTHIWASKWYDAERSTCLYFRGDKDNMYYSQKFNKAKAGSVRCVVFDPDAIVPPTPSDGGGDEPGDAVADLSADGSANSYVVDKAGDYKFKAVKGNSAESVGAVASAEILWETENTATAPEQNSIIAKAGVDGDYITFSTPAEMKAGNALIAAKNAAGDILWSWHIWIPASEVAVKDGAALCGAPIMDRNLGALTAMPMSGTPDPLSIGLAYQWGRKDPFPGMISFAENKGAAVAGTEWTAHSTETVSTAYSIAHPTEYVHIAGVDDGVWNVDDPKDLWNDAENKKTIYDPCPPGYRVPLYDSSLPMWSGSFGDAWTIDAANYRFAYGEISFPVGGYIDCWTPGYEKTGLRTHIWASKWYDEKRATCLYYREGAYYAQKFHKAKAGNVRCVAE